MSSVLGALLRPGIDWIKRVAVMIAFAELAAEASEAAGGKIEPPTIEGVEQLSLPAPDKKAKRS